MEILYDCKKMHLQVALLGICVDLHLDVEGE